MTGYKKDASDRPDPSEGEMDVVFFLKGVKDLKYVSQSLQQPCESFRSRSSQ